MNKKQIRRMGTTAALAFAMLAGGTEVGNGRAYADEGETWARDTVQAERDRIREVEREADRIQGGGNREGRETTREPAPRESPTGR